MGGSVGGLGARPEPDYVHGGGLRLARLRELAGGVVPLREAERVLLRDRHCQRRQRVVVCLDISTDVSAIILLVHHILSLLFHHAFFVVVVYGHVELVLCVGARLKHGIGGEALRDDAFAARQHVVFGCIRGF